MIRRILSLVFVTILVVGVGAATYFLSIQLSSYPESMAEFRVQTGQATINSNGEQTIVTPEDRTPARLGTGGRIKSEGASILTFIGTQIELESGTEMIVKRYLSRDNEAQIDLELIKGQIVQHIAGYANPRSLYTLTAGSSILSTRGGDFISHRSNDGVVWHVSELGVADVAANAQSVHLQTNAGTYIRLKEPPTIPTQWGTLSVPTYKPDGTTVDLPLQMTNQKTGEQFSFVSNHQFLLPTGIYDLQVLTLNTYTIKDLNIESNSFHEYPITFSEVVFNLVDSADQSLSYSSLKLKGDLETKAVPNTPVLLPPGEVKLVASREESPELLQPLDLNLLPGQQILLAVHDNLFGGGTIQVKLGTVEGEEVAPLNVSIYAADQEDAAPLDSFKSNAVSKLIPAGDYVVVVSAQIAGRYTMTVRKNENAVLDIPLGYLHVDYVDEQGQPVTKNVIVYIASMGEMRRTGLSIEQMRSTPYGKALAISNADKMLVPADTYAVMIDDRVNVSKDSVEVPPGKTEVVTLQVQPQ